MGSTMMKKYRESFGFQAGNYKFASSFRGAVSKFSWRYFTKIRRLYDQEECYYNRCCRKGLS
jgi:hypothetical protein